MKGSDSGRGRGRPELGIYLLALATFVTFLSERLISPVVPVLAGRLGAEELVMAATSGLPIVLLAAFQVFTGAFADRYGRRVAISFGASLSALSALLCAFAGSWLELLVLMALGGVADAFVGPALLALVADLSLERRGTAMGIFRSSQGLAFIVGPVLGGGLARLLSLRAPFLLDFALTLIGVLLFLRFVPELRTESSAAPPLRSLRFIVKDRRLLMVAVLGFTETFAFAAWSTLLPVLVVKLGMAELEVATLLSLEAISFTIATTLMGAASDRVGRMPIMAVGLTLSLISLSGYYLARELHQLALCTATYGFASASVYVMSSAMAADILPEEGRATLFGAFDALMDLGIVFGPSICLGALALTGWGVREAFPLMAVPTLAALPLLLKVGETKTL